MRNAAILLLAALSGCAAYEPGETDRHCTRGLQKTFWVTSPPTTTWRT